MQMKKLNSPIRFQEIEKHGLPELLWIKKLKKTWQQHMVATIGLLD